MSLSNLFGVPVKRRMTKLRLKYKGDKNEKRWRDGQHRSNFRNYLPVLFCTEIIPEISRVEKQTCEIYRWTRSRLLILSRLIVSLIPLRWIYYFIRKKVRRSNDAV